MLSDVKFAVRMLLKNPAFTLTCIGILGLGIGATTAVFSVVNSVLLRPLPFPESDRLVSVWDSAPKTGRDRFRFSYPEFQDRRAQGGCLNNVSMPTMPTAPSTGTEN